MEDLILKAKKFARGAGHTQEGQRLAAERIELLSKCISWVSVVLSAVVGTSIFAEWISIYPFPFGIAAAISAALGALQSTSKLDERAENHRMIAAEYGGLRRRIDLLRLQLEAGDIKRREDGIRELYKVADDLLSLAKKARTLPDRIYKPAKKSFKKTHAEYYSNPPTHSGGVVFRKDNDAIKYLVIQASEKADEWVLPKGHIKDGETAEQASKREVSEEAGILACILKPLDIVKFRTTKEQVKAQFFLMEAKEEVTPKENREHKWLSFEDAVKKLNFNESRLLICQAHLIIKFGIDNNNS